VIVLRRATLADAALLLRWRNDKASRASAFRSEVVTPDEHARWLSRKLDDPLTVIWVAERESVAVGQVRIDLTDEREGEVDLTVAPGARGRGYAAEILRLATEALTGLDITAVVAQVRDHNEASLRAFRRAGFVEVQRRPGVIVLRRELL
jgi:RimJ/RimL family protein N-acetyltransferase